MDSTSLPKFQSQFWGGLLTGAALSALLVVSFAVPRIDETFDFADANMRLFFAAQNDIEKLNSVCGTACDEVEMSHLKLFKTLFK